MSLVPPVWVLSKQPFSFCMVEMKFYCIVDILSREGPMSLIFDLRYFWYICCVDSRYLLSMELYSFTTDADSTNNATLQHRYTASVVTWGRQCRDSVTCSSEQILNFLGGVSTVPAKIWSSCWEIQHRSMTYRYSVEVVELHAVVHYLLKSAGEPEWSTTSTTSAAAATSSDSRKTHGKKRKS